MSPVMPNPRSGRITSGFSLVELMVVVMVILVIAAIAIPSFVHARMKANEASAVSSLNVIRTAEFMYASEYPEIGFAPTLAVLGSNSTDCQHPSRDASCLITDDEITSGVKNGYVFELVANDSRPATDFTAKGTPQANGFSGRCGFVAGATTDVGVLSSNGALGRFQMADGGGCGP